MAHVDEAFNNTTVRVSAAVACSEHDPHLLYTMRLAERINNTLNDFFYTGATKLTGSCTLKMHAR